jgi:hypothetical protein
MKKQTPNNSNAQEDEKLRHFDEYHQFVAWIGLPVSLRIPKTQKELAKNLGVGEDTLSEWKQRDGFFKAVEKKRKEWGQERTPEVIHALYKRIMKYGGATETKLWLQYIENWSEKTAPEETSKRPFEDMTDEELIDAIKEARKLLSKK